MNRPSPGGLTSGGQRVRRYEYFLPPLPSKEGQGKGFGNGSGLTKQNPLQKLKSKFAVKDGAWEVLQAQEVLKK